MKFVRGFSSLLFATLCTTAISLTVSFYTLNATLLNQSEVKRWIKESGIYIDIIPTILKNAPQEAQAQPTQSLLTQEVIARVFSESMPPEFVQSQVEQVIDGTYAWLEGREGSVKFRLPLDQKKDTVIANLKKAILPKIQALPPCVTLSDLTRTQSEFTCRPQNLTADEFAETISSQAVSNIGLFERPLTESAFTIKAPDPSADPVGAQAKHLPMYRQWFGLALIITPLVALAGALGVFLVSTDKLRSYVRLSRQIFIGSLLTTALAALIIYTSRYITLPGTADQGDIIKLLTPVIHIGAQGIATTLATYSAIPMVIGLITWLYLRNRYHNREALLVTQREVVVPEAELPTVQVEKDISKDPSQPPGSMPR